MVNAVSKPKRSPCRRRMRRQAVWKVCAQTAEAASSSSSAAVRRSRSSRAALLVKVIAMTSHGFAGCMAHSRSACARFSGRGSVRYSVRNSRSCSAAPSGAYSLVSPCPKRRILMMRLMSTVVLPLPAPAKMSRGPSVAYTASRCFSLRPEKRCSMTARRTAAYFKSNFVGSIGFLVSLWRYRNSIA